MDRQNRQPRVVLYLAGWLLVTLSGCASWSTNALRSSANSASPFESTLSLARLSERHGEPSSAEQVYQAVLAKDPQNQVAHHRLAILAIKEQQFDQAQHYFDQALAGTPNSQLLSDWGYFLYLRDRHPEAEAALRQSLQLDHGNTKAHNNLGLVLGTMNRMDESLAEFRFAGNEATARANLGYVHSLNGEFKQSEAEYHQALQLDNQLKSAAEALLALHARNDANTASALAFNPTIPAHVAESLQPFRGDGQPMPNLASVLENPSPAAGQADRSPPQVVTVSYTDQNSKPQTASRAATAVETTGLMMNMPAEANPAGNAVLSTSEATTNRQATQLTPVPSYAAPLSLQSLQPQAWQMPTWTGLEAR